MRWLVIWHRDADPPQVFPFADYDDALAHFTLLTITWTGVLLCEVVKDAGRPGSEPTP